MHLLPNLQTYLFIYLFDIFIQTFVCSQCYLQSLHAKFTFLRPLYCHRESLVFSFMWLLHCTM